MQMFKIREIHSQDSNTAYIKPSFFYHTQYTIMTKLHTYLLQKQGECITATKDKHHFFTAHIQYQIQSIAQSKIKPPRASKLSFAYHSDTITLILQANYSVTIYINDVLIETIPSTLFNHKIVQSKQLSTTLYAICLIIAHWMIFEDTMPIIY